jgi:hypothetical protein
MGAITVKNDEQTAEKDENTLLNIIYSEITMYDDILHLFLNGIKIKTLYPGFPGSVI